ncbi:MAG: metal ABC transporter permease [Gammaproteobacteria bacterium SG8_47]|nr:MAG: metal ABC transporter permease [Gammaproteobacteria bacterium SG8_47]
MSFHGHRPTAAPHGERRDVSNLRRVLPYIWDYRGRVLIALLALMLSKLAIVGVPLVLKQIVDTLDAAGGGAIALPVVLLLAYGGLRAASTLFNELRDAVFARVRYHAMRRLAGDVLRHLYLLSLRFHLERHTGGISRDLERGTQSVSNVLNYLVFNILPTAAEFVLVAVILLSQYDAEFALIIFATVVVYIAFTLAVTEWRMHYRHHMNALDSKANGQAVDGLLNYETVKYFDNEDFELTRYDQTLGAWEEAAVKSQTSMSLLNFGQGAVIAVGVTGTMLYAAQGVASGSLTLGDLVLINTMMLQLFIPLNFLGVIYRALKHALADMDSMFKLLERSAEVTDDPHAVALSVGRGQVRFDAVSFAYQPDRPILDRVSFTVEPGQKIAVVGPSGAGKSTLVRLLFRFYDATAGRIFIDDQDVRSVTQSSLRHAVGIVPQDTVLFNDTLYSNILYARPGASFEEVARAAELAHLREFIESLPDGYDTVVGERGLKLSGGEKQRMAIARVILKQPRILVFDEATSSLDSRSEQAILGALREVAAGHTTIVIAHRLSTIVDADRILVLDGGRIVESGAHHALLQQGGLYAHLWQLQQEERASQARLAAEGYGELSSA